MPAGGTVRLPSSCMLLLAACVGMSAAADLGGLTTGQTTWYDNCMQNTPFEDYEFRNWMCTCKANPTTSLANGAFQVDPVCLPMGYTPPEGGIMGGAGGRVWTLDPENACTGNAFTVHSVGVPGSTDIIATWAEDFTATTGRDNAHIHVTRLTLSGGRYTVLADIKLPGCVFNGGVVVNKRGDIATYCLATCPHCSGDATWGRFEPFVVEVKPDLSQEIRRGSAMHPSCVTEDKYCYAVNRGTLFHWMEYDPVRDVYAMWYNGGWANHVGDVMSLLEADPAKNLPRLSSCDRLEAGWRWECNKGHTTGTKMVYHPEFQDFGAMCTTDLVAYGMRYRRVYTKTGARYGLTENENTWSASATWPGSMVACGCHYFTVFHGVRAQGDYNAGRGVGLGFMRTDPLMQKEKYVVWLSTDTVNVRSVRLAVLGDGAGCNRFALGWGEMGLGDVYPTKFFIVEVDSEGTFLTEKLEVTSATFWGEDDEWVTLPNGDVSWTSTWKRNEDGSPNKINQDPATLGPRKSGKVTCTYGGQNTGYGHSNLRHFNTIPSWDQDGPRRTWGTSGFKTNEMFVSRIASAKRIGGLTKAGWIQDNSPQRHRHPECAEVPVQSDACRDEFDLTAAPSTAAPPATPTPVVSLPPMPPFTPAVQPPFTPRAGCTQLSGATGTLDYPEGSAYYANHLTKCWDIPCHGGIITLTWRLFEVEEDGNDKVVVGGNNAQGFTQSTAYEGEGGTSKDKLPTMFYSGAKILLSTDDDYRYEGFIVDWVCAVAGVTPVPMSSPTSTPATSAPATSAPPTSAPATSAPVTSAPATSAPATSAPDTSAPATSAPDTSAPDTSALATSAPATSAPVTTAPDTSAPLTSAPATSVPLTSAPETSAPDTSAPDTSAPKTSVPATSTPDTSAPATSAPPTSAPATSVPDTSAPVTAAPHTSAPRTSAPATSAPDTSAPETSAPATSAPDTSAPDTSAPDTSAPPTSAPETSVPVTSAPATSAPPTSAPATSAPVTSAPATTAPNTSAPDTSAPATSAPDTSAPATSAPKTSVPATSTPDTSAPATSAPPTSAPATSVPDTSAPVTAAPHTSAPATSAPDTSAPATSAPATSAPDTSAPPTSAPETSVPVTSAPATSAPATSAPATSAPPTSAPATSAPVTSAPPTAAPDTSAPATSAPATSAPATSAPDTSAPATSEPSTGIPTPTVCKDKNLADGNLWVDSRGTIGKNKYSCHWYRRRTRCARHGATWEKEDMTANDACCVCGGGVWM